MPETLEMQEITQNLEQNEIRNSLSDTVNNPDQNGINISINYEPKEEARKISKRNLILGVVLSFVLALGFAIFGVLWYNFPPTATDSNISRNRLRQETYEQGNFCLNINIKKSLI